MGSSSSGLRTFMRWVAVPADVLYPPWYQITSSPPVLNFCLETACSVWLRIGQPRVFMRLCNQCMNEPRAVCRDWQLHHPMQLIVPFQRKLKLKLISTLGRSRVEATPHELDGGLFNPAWLHIARRLNPRVAFPVWLHTYRCRPDRRGSAGNEW